MKESKKMILRLLSKDGKKSKKFDLLVLNLALQKIDSDNFDFDGQAVYTADRKRLVYCLSDKDSSAIPEGVEVIGEMAFRRKKRPEERNHPADGEEDRKRCLLRLRRSRQRIYPSSVTTVRRICFCRVRLAEDGYLCRYTQEHQPPRFRRQR